MKSYRDNTFFCVCFFLPGNTFPTTAYLRFCFWQTLTDYNLCILYSTCMRKVDAIMITIFIDGNTGAEIINDWIKHTLVFLFPLQVISNHIWSPSKGFILLKGPMLTPMNTHCNYRYRCLCPCRELQPPLTEPPPPQEIS